MGVTTSSSITVLPRPRCENCGLPAPGGLVVDGLAGRLGACCDPEVAAWLDPETFLSGQLAEPAGQPHVAEAGPRSRGGDAIDEF